MRVCKRCAGRVHRGQKAAHLLADGGVARELLGAFDHRLVARRECRDGEHVAPLGELRAILVVLLAALAEPVEACEEHTRKVGAKLYYPVQMQITNQIITESALLPESASDRRQALVDFDARNDSLVLQQLHTNKYS